MLMLRFAAIGLFLIYLVSFTEFKEVLRLPLLVEHYGEHKDKVAEIKVYVPRHSFFVKHQSKAFEQSFDHAFDSMVTRIKRQKEKTVA